MKRLCLLLTVEMGLIVKETQLYGRFLDLKLEPRFFSALVSCFFG
jgi:hypothetical protein